MIFDILCFIALGITIILLITDIIVVAKVNKKLKEKDSN